MVNGQCTYNGVDFSPLTNNADDWTGQDPAVLSYFYRFNVCRNTVKTYSGSSCPTGDAAYQTGTATGASPCYANLGAWTSPTWFNLTTPDFGVGLKYGNGRVCFGVPGAFLIKFTCNPDGPEVPVPSPYFAIRENGQCQYEVTMPTSLSCGIDYSDYATEECGVGSFDFSALALSPDEAPYFGNDTAGFAYEFNICSGVESVCGPASRHAVAYQYVDDVNEIPDTCQTLGTIDSVNPPFWRQNEQRIPMVTYYGGGVCGDIERSVTYTFYCGSSLYPSGSHVFSEVSTCNYQVDLYTSLACEEALLRA